MLNLVSKPSSLLVAAGVAALSVVSSVAPAEAATVFNVSGTINEIFTQSFVAPNPLLPPPLPMQINTPATLSGQVTYTPDRGVTAASILLDFLDNRAVNDLTFKIVLENFSEPDGRSLGLQTPDFFGRLVFAIQPFEFPLREGVQTTATLNSFNLSSPDDTGGSRVVNSPNFSNVTFTPVPASTPIPTPALLPGLVGMGVAALRKRQLASAEVSSEA